MEIRNNNQTFGAKLGADAKYYLKNNSAKLEQISNRIAGFGEPTTVIDIMSAKTVKGKAFSLRIYNEIFGSNSNISLLKDNHNKDVISFCVQDILKYLESITEKQVIFKENSLFSKIKKEFLALPLGRKLLSQKLKQAETDGKVLKETAKRSLL